MCPDAGRDTPRGDGEESARPGDGLTEEFEAEFGEEFGADVVDGIAGDQGEAPSEPDPEPEPVEVAAESAPGSDQADPPGEPEDEPEESVDEPDAIVDGDAEEDEASPIAEHDQQADELETADDAPPKSGLLARFAVGSLLIVSAMAAATSLTAFLFFSDLADGDLPDVPFTPPDPGQPQTILIMGSDKRAGDGAGGRSDTTMLLRIDPEGNGIALLSLPRDLRVEIPGHGEGRLNEAYTLGGPTLTTETVERLTGLEINHGVNVDFEGFEQAINALDCLYVDVDRQYFHSNEGLAVSDYFSEIDIKAGYQLLCGDRALQYARYRHTDNDLVRSARQQDLLREVRQKLSPRGIFEEREKLTRIFTEFTSSDISDAGELAAVMKLMLGATDAPVTQIHFEGNLGSSYVTASSRQIETAVDEFLGAREPDGEARKDSKPKPPSKPDDEPKPESIAPALVDSSGAGLAYAEQFAPEVGFPVFYPTKLAPSSEIIGESREYKVADEDGKVHMAYKLVFQIPGESVPAEFYGLMGTTWTDPPILDSPSETREIGGREYDLFFDGDRLRMIAWSTGEAAYWLSNTLLQTLDESEMVAIADSIAEQAPPKRGK